jgi:hypothetical protein
MGMRSTTQTPKTNRPRSNLRGTRGQRRNTDIPSCKHLKCAINATSAVTSWYSASNAIKELMQTEMRSWFVVAWMRDVGGGLVWRRR